MTPTEFLRAVAAILPGRPSPSRTSALCQFSTKLAHDFRGDFTADLADKVGRAMDEFPSYDELLTVVRRYAPLHRERPPAEVLQFKRPEPAEDEKAEQDRAWWAERIEAVAVMKNPTARWAEAMGMRATLTRPKAWPRPWAIQRLDGIIAQAEADGAKTDPNAVVWPHGTDGWRPHRIPALHGPSGATADGAAPAPKPLVGALPADHLARARADLAAKRAAQ